MRTTHPTPGLRSALPPDPPAERAQDLVDRQFTVEAPNQLLVADFAYVKLGDAASQDVADRCGGVCAGHRSGDRDRTPIPALRSLAALGAPVDEQGGAEVAQRLPSAVVGPVARRTHRRGCS